MKIINRIILQNFKRYDSFDTPLNQKLNIFIGDNESGKSSILEAIDIVLSGSRSKVETVGISNLLNKDSIRAFFGAGKHYEQLPKMIIEVYLDDCGNADLNGDNNSIGINSDGLSLICEPNNQFSKDIRAVLEQEGENFPYEFYSISFKTFADKSYSGFNKYFNHILLDNSQINNEYATRSYVKKLFHSNADVANRSVFENHYRGLKQNFQTEILGELNDGLPYQFALKSNSKSNLETDITITEDDIEIENRGKGRQCFIKTDFALDKSKIELDTVLLEEPENHLSHNYTLKLIDKIKATGDKQVIIATHSNMIAARLGLKECIMLNSSGTRSIRLNDIEESSSRFFMKAPDNNVLQFVMSPKVILVEGDAEFILIESFFKKTIGHEPHVRDVHIISGGGKTFKRYLDLARNLNIKIAVITDNDRSYGKNITHNYKDYVKDNWLISADQNDERYTFEVSLYQDNKAICDAMFGPGRTTLTVLEYMLQNKAECALRLLEEKAEELVIPKYIQKAIVWISA
ncbi:MAG: putative ATP-dependent endonuclease of OLD family [Roseivirga sp.]|jgi:putative ATP-dependent endonuclease of OLD family